MLGQHTLGSVKIAGLGWDGLDDCFTGLLLQASPLERMGERTPPDHTLYVWGKFPRCWQSILKRMNATPMFSGQWH